MLHSDQFHSTETKQDLVVKGTVHEARFNLNSTFDDENDGDHHAADDDDDDYDDDDYDDDDYDDDEQHYATLL